MKYCSKCGRAISSEDKFCKACGNPIVNKKEDTEKTQSYEDIENDPKKVEEEKIDKKNNEEEKVQQKVNYKNGKTIKKSSHKFIPLIVILIVIIALGSVAAINSDRIKGYYYTSKCNDATIGQEKLNYAIKAFKSYSTVDTNELLKNTLTNMAAEDVDAAEKALDNVSDSLIESDYQKLAIVIKECKINKLCDESKYSQALSELEQINNLGGYIKENKHYEDIMYNVIAQLTSTSVKGSKNILSSEDGICFDNFDNDPFDEIIQIKYKGSLNSAETKAILYKYKEGKYIQTDSKSLMKSYSGNIDGIFNYDTSKKGVFISYSHVNNNYGTTVFGVDGENLSCKGTVYGQSYTKVEDFNNDGIYEILSESSSNLYSKQVSKWYKVNEDGSTPTEVVGNNESTTTTKSKASTGEYIIKTSNSEFLTNDDVNVLDKDTLALARNEIFARYGYVFKEEPYKSYFQAKEWYKANSSFDGSDDDFNKYEKANIQIIKEWEIKNADK